MVEFTKKLKKHLICAWNYLTKIENLSLKKPPLLGVFFWKSLNMFNDKYLLNCFF
jgi:hypothetical protein